MTSWQKWLVRGSIALFGLSAGGAMLFILATVPPHNNPIYPKCMSYTLLGLHCPGCGLTRATHELFNGRFRQSIAYNIWLIPALSYVTLVGLRSAWQWAWGQPIQMWKWPTYLVWVGVGLFFLYGIVRNIPIEPFSWLAPHQIPR